MYDKTYYDNKKQEIQKKFQSAQQKWIQTCEFAGKEYISFQERIAELNENLQRIAKEEEVSKTEPKTEPKKK